MTLWTRTRELAAIAGSLQLLAGAAVDASLRVSAADAGPYHARVRQAAGRAPLTLGPWQARDVPQPEEVVALLRPNVLLCREFENKTSGERCSLLVVQCQDVRDLTPHYPPVCYPGRGLTLISTGIFDWQVGGLKVSGTEYDFESNTFRSPNLTIVENFMVLPNGRITPDMTAVKEQVALKNRYFGAAQFQVVFDSDISQERRRAITEEILSGYKPLIEAIRSGVAQ
jgi:hypothetical protein